MNDDDYGESIGPDAVRFERVLPGPVERVWACLTDPGKRARWLCGGEMELRAGGEVEFHFNNSTLPDRTEPVPDKYAQYEGIRFSGRIERCEPPRLLCFTWPEEHGGESEVAIELSERNGGVLLVLTHRRLADRKSRIGACGGWHSHLDVLAARLEGRAVAGFWSRHAALEAEYKRRLA